MNLQICFMNEDSETIEIDGSTVGGLVDEAVEISLVAASLQSVDSSRHSTLTPSATLVAQHSNSSLDEGVGGKEASAYAAAAEGSLMKNSKSVGHFLHCLLPGKRIYSTRLNPF